ncbi:MAG: amidohydrolase, partial [Alphaproteobacteria bacterium PA3]
MWFEPVEPLVLQMDLNGVARAVLTQALGQFDNSYQAECLTRYPGRFASVVGIDAGDPNAPGQIAIAAADGAVGVRLRPDARSSGDDPLALWRAVADHGLVVSCAGATAANLSPDFHSLLTAFPKTIFVLEHLGGWTRADCDRSPAAREGILELAVHDNVFLKVPALG